MGQTLTEKSQLLPEASPELHCPQNPVPMAVLHAHSGQDGAFCEAAKTEGGTG